MAVGGASGEIALAPSPGVPASPVRHSGEGRNPPLAALVVLPPVVIPAEAGIHCPAALVVLPPVVIPAEAGIHCPAALIGLLRRVMQ